MQKSAAVARRFLANSVRDRLVLRHVRAWRHGNDLVLALFVIGLNYPKEEFVLVNAKLRRLSYREEGWMLVVLGPNAVSDAIGLECVLLAENLFGVFVLSVGAQNLPG